MSWLMFLSLLKNIAECFMKAIKDLSFSSANEHQPYVNTRKFSFAAAAALGDAVFFFFFPFSFFLPRLWSCAKWPRSCRDVPGVCLDGNRCDVASVALN